jgi:hypothetical protein
VSQVSDQVAAQLDALVRPTAGDVLQAKRVVLGRLSDGERVSADELRRAVVADGGGIDQPDRDAFIQLHDVLRDPSVTLDRTEPLIVRVRLELAAEEAIAELAVDGVAIAAESPGQPGDVSLPVGDMAGGSGWRGGHYVRVARQLLAGTYRLERRHAADASLMEMTAALDTAALSDLLADRGQRCFDEAVRAFRRGLYLAAANLAAAASEAAWYTIANVAVAQDQRLEKPLEDDNTAKLTQITAEILRRAPRSTTIVNELQAQAAHLRDLRNYAVHPRPEADAHLEAHLTEVGCLALLSTTVRYLARLRGAAQAAGVLPVSSTVAASAT